MFGRNLSPEAQLCIGANAAAILPLIIAVVCFIRRRFIIIFGRRNDGGQKSAADVDKFRALCPSAEVCRNRRN